MLALYDRWVQVCRSVWALRQVVKERSFRYSAIYWDSYGASFKNYEHNWTLRSNGLFKRFFDICELHDRKCAWEHKNGIKWHTYMHVCGDVETRAIQTNFKSHSSRAIWVCRLTSGSCAVRIAVRFCQKGIFWRPPDQLQDTGILWLIGLRVCEILTPPSCCYLSTLYLV